MRCHDAHEKDFFVFSPLRKGGAVPSAGFQRGADLYHSAQQNLLFRCYDLKYLARL